MRFKPVFHFFRIGEGVRMKPVPFIAYGYLHFFLI